MKKLNDVNELNSMNKQDIIEWCQELPEAEKLLLQDWISDTGKSDFMSVKHYLGHKFYPHFYKQKEPTFTELLEKALIV